MKKTQQPPMRLSQRHERWLHAIGLLVFLSGIGWLADHYLFAGSEDFGDAHAPSEPLWLRLHGAAAMAGLVVFGSLLPGHIARAWRVRGNFRSGLLMLSLVVLLVVTGYGLYYAGDEETRPWISIVHWLAGTLAAAGLVLHVRFGKRWIQRRLLVGSSDLAANPSSLLVQQEVARAKSRGDSGIDRSAVSTATNTLSRG